LEKGAGEFTIEQPFLISKYPITNAQFQPFIDEKGYENKTWWEGFETQLMQSKPSTWPEANHPRTGVSWFEAMAYCRWLSRLLRDHDRLPEGAEIRLPDEWEWQQAATGGDPDNIYPWGKDYQSGFANLDETDTLFSEEKVGKQFLGRTSAVGLYHSGRSRQGVYDLTGNVWEWCRNKHVPASCNAIDDSSDSRLVRGGAWYGQASLARSAFRHDFHPVLRDDSLGFRVLCCPPSSDTDH
jgi:formylglycine-generating enzyme required for sulfatase activity